VAAGGEENSSLVVLFQEGSLLDEGSQFFEYFVAIEPFATRGLGGAAFQFSLQLLESTIWLLTHGRFYFAD